MERTYLVTEELINDIDKKRELLDIVIKGIEDKIIKCENTENLVEFIEKVTNDIIEIVRDNTQC